MFVPQMWTAHQQPSHPFKDFWSSGLGRHPVQDAK